MEEKRIKVRLDEVTLMRCVLALLIVFMHSFTCYNGGWPEPEGFVDVPVYKWMSRFSFAFTLQAFVFISGYLFAFQRITLKRTVGCIHLIINKLKRLILPSILFSIVYFIIFYPYKGLGNAVYSIINGCGHMWFLPMLFWCFIGGWLLDQIKIGNGWKLGFLLFLNVFWVIYLPLPFQLNRAISYLLYFYLGSVVYEYSNGIKKHLSCDMVALSWVAFLIMFVLLRPLRDVLIRDSDNSKILNVFIIARNNLCLVLYACSGLMAFYFTSVYYVQRKVLHSFTIKLAGCCFGIYLFQQFILQFLYYKTSFPIMVGPYWLPCLGFVITLIVSYILSVLLLKTKFGRFLIG